MLPGVVGFMQKSFLRNKEFVLLISNSCVNNYFIYCSAAWVNCSHHLLLRLLRLQKRAGRILLDASLGLVFLYF